jgi:excisionase family DNA binding protein
MDFHIKGGLHLERLLTPKEAGEIMAVTSRTVKEWLRRGELKGVKIRNLWRIRESELETFIRKGSPNNLNSEPSPSSIGTVIRTQKNNPL